MINNNPTAYGPTNLSHWLNKGVIGAEDAYLILYGWPAMGGFLPPSAIHVNAASLQATLPAVTKRLERLASKGRIRTRKFWCSDGVERDFYMRAQPGLEVTERLNFQLPAPGGTKATQLAFILGLDITSRHHNRGEDAKDRYIGEGAWAKLYRQRYSTLEVNNAICDLCDESVIEPGIDGPTTRRYQQGLQVYSPSFDPVAVRLDGKDYAREQGHLPGRW